MIAEKHKLFSFFPYLSTNLQIPCILHILKHGVGAGAWGAAIPPLLRQEGGHARYGQERQVT